MTEAMRNGPDRFVVSETWHETTIDDLEDTSFVFDGSIGSLIENASHLTVALGRAFTAVHACALIFARACSYPRDQILGRREGRCLGTHFGNDLLRRIHPQTGDFRQSLHCILMLTEQTRGLLVEFADLLLDQLQVRKCHFHQPAVDRVELGAGTQCIAQLYRGGTQALIS